jgi:AraC family transcriptional regulator of adaptative response / DNA-3-methyladenine glycosylase II
VPGVEAIEAGVVRRALSLDGVPLVVEVEARPETNALAVRVRGGDAPAWLAVSERVRSVFDVGADPSEIAQVLDADPELRARRERLPGWRVPGAWEPFELAARIVLGQQVTVAGATRLAGRLAERFGEPLPDELLDPTPIAPRRLFPRPDILADAPLEEIGLTRQRAAALRHLAGAVVDGRLDLTPGADPEAARDALLSLSGIGPWTADLVLMRALNHPDAFPAGDLGLRRALGCDAAALERRAERWRPWRAYAAMLLWCVPSVSGRAPRRSTPRREKPRHRSSSAPGDPTCPTRPTQH